VSIGWACRHAFIENVHAFFVLAQRVGGRVHVVWAEQIQRPKPQFLQYSPNHVSTILGV
jgi:hypothetical protein